MLLSLTVILSLVPPITAAAADKDTGIMPAGATTLEISADEAFLWESSTDRTTLAGINPEWYKTNVTDAGVQRISIKIPASTETIRKDFGGVYATHKGFSTDGKQLAPVVPNCEQVFVDFSAAIHLKTIGLQAFFQVRGLGDDPGLTRTTDDAFYIRARYIDAWTVTFDSNGGTIINRAVMQIAVRKVWKGMDEGEKRPNIKLTLYCKL